MKRCILVATRDVLEVNLLFLASIADYFGQSNACFEGRGRETLFGSRSALQGIKRR